MHPVAALPQATVLGTGGPPPATAQRELSSPDNSEDDEYYFFADLGRLMLEPASVAYIFARHAERERQAGREGCKHETEIGRDVREDHRVDEPDPRRDPGRRQRRHRQSVKTHADEYIPYDAERAELLTTALAQTQKSKDKADQAARVTWARAFFFVARFRRLGMAHQFFKSPINTRENADFATEPGRYGFGPDYVHRHS